MEKKESKQLISSNDAKILAQKMVVNNGLSSAYSRMNITVEMHVYDLMDNKILSVHAIPNMTWELYDKDEALARKK